MPFPDHRIGWAVNRSAPDPVLAQVRTERCGTRRAVSPGSRALGRSLLLIIAVVAGLLAMHTSPFVPGEAAHANAPAAQDAAQAAPAVQDAPGDPDGGGPGGCSCAGGCDDMSACPALSVPHRSPADLAVDLADLAPSGDAPAAAGARPVGGEPARPPIGLRVTAVTVTRI